ncbi:MULTISPECIES: class I SAM-dependent methyltransferase [unclassified Enterococcus]|jgi:SAM-dependent methyltransferase|uniref:class I SAM-dependent methyltransferase n=1 Tax=unclassified Enterococcus TaxID=2608891 RepID=UPI003D2D56C5
MKYDFEMDLDEQSSVGKIAAQIKPGSKVLEFGPGNGRLTKHLIGAKNCEVSIVELDKELFDFVSQIAQDGFYGDIESFEWANYFEGKTFDYVLFADVLEHLVDPGKTLAKVREFLNEEGEILITFPNLAHNSVLIDLFNNQLPWASYGLLDETHNSFYTHEGFQKVFEKAGLFINIEDYLHLAVEDTELTSEYQDLPPETRYAFKMRPFGEVYQYFFSLKKHPTEASIAEPKNSTYVKTIEAVYYTNTEETVQSIPINDYTGENEILVLPMPADLNKFVVRFDQQPSFIEFSVQAAGEKLPFINSNAVIKTAQDCYIFDGSETPYFEIDEVAGKELTIHCHYRFTGEFSQTLNELMETIKPMAHAQQQLEEKIDHLTKEKRHLQENMNVLQGELDTTAQRYHSLLDPERWSVKERGFRRMKETSKKIQEKELLLHIDQKNWDPETKILTINGWGADKSTRRELSYSLSENQAPFFAAASIYREEVNAAENLPKDVSAGFELRILCDQEQTFIVKATAQDGRSWLVQM